MQPTRGLDVAAIEYVHKRLIDQAAAGTAILLISSELDEILTLSDRIAVLRDGKNCRHVVTLRSVGRDDRPPNVGEIGRCREGCVTATTSPVALPLDDRWRAIGTSVAIVVAALAVTGLLLLASRVNPLRAYLEILRGAFSSVGTVSETFFSTPRR